MKKINAKQFGFSFFLSDRKPVDNLEEAAKKHGGATFNADTGEQYSNTPGDEFIRVHTGHKLNTLSVYVPDTVNVNQQANKAIVKRIISTVAQRLYKRYSQTPTIEKGIGTWFSDNLQAVVYDNLVIMSIHAENITEADIFYFKRIGQYVRKEMQQEGVSVAINTALGIV